MKKLKKRKQIKHRSPTPPPGQIHRDKSRYSRVHAKRELRNELS